MKRVFVSFLVIFFTLFGISSCSINDDSDENFYFESIEVISAEFPDTFKHGDIYRIRVNFERPTNCHFFEGFDFKSTGETERTIVGIASAFSGDDCQDLADATIENFFDFEVLYSDTYTFKLWAGKDDDGENEYLIIEVPVED